MSQPEQTGSKAMHKRDAIRKIRSLGVTKVNSLVKAAANLEELVPAFTEWQSGEIYVCQKKGDYRYRFGTLSKSTAPWSATALRLFSSPAAFAFAAMVFAAPAQVKRDTVQASGTRVNTAKVKPKQAQETSAARRANVIKIAQFTPLTSSVA